MSHNSSRQVGFSNDYVSVLSHREGDDCAWWYGRECDCSAPREFLDKMRMLGVSFEQVGDNTVPFEKDKDGWDD